MHDEPEWLTQSAAMPVRPIGPRVARALVRFVFLVVGVLGTTVVMLTANVRDDVQAEVCLWTILALMPISFCIALTQGSKGRWFAFSLRTLLVAVAVFGCLLWLGSNVRKVRERRFWMEAGALKYVVSNARHPSRPLPLVWSLMGAQPVAAMKTCDGDDPDERQRFLSFLRDLFPEADVTFGYRPGEEWGGEVDDEDMLE